MPRHAPRYVETRLGILSYAELAPYLARNVLALERRIESGEFSQSLLDDALLLQFQRLLCGDLVPQLAGWRRTDVTVGAHTPPKFFRVPPLIREYGHDLQARLSSPSKVNDETLLETLAFTEGTPAFHSSVRRFQRARDPSLATRGAPPVRLVPAVQTGINEYLSALQAADRNDWRPLMNVWLRRFEDVWQ